MWVQTHVSPLPFPSSWPAWASSGWCSGWHWRQGANQGRGRGRQSCRQLHHASVLVPEQLQKVRLIRFSIQIKLLEELSRGALLHILLFLLLMQVLLQLRIFKILASLPEGFLQLLELLCASPRLVRVFLQSSSTEHLHHILHLRASWHLLEAKNPQESPKLGVHFPLHRSTWFKGWKPVGYFGHQVNWKVCGNFAVTSAESEGETVSRPHTELRPVGQVEATSRQHEGPSRSQTPTSPFLLYCLPMAMAMRSV